VDAQDLWTKTERDAICDQVLMSETKPNELHRAKKTVNALMSSLRSLLDATGRCYALDDDHCETTRSEALLRQLL
jgi:hypothetical protein